MSEELPAPSPARSRLVLPVHPLLFAIFPALTLYARNMEEIPFAQMLIPIGVTLAATGILWLLAALVTRHLRKAAAAATAVIVAYASYGPVSSFLIAPQMKDALALTEIAVIATLLLLLARSKQPLWDTTSALNLAGAFLILSSLWSIGYGYWRTAHAVAIHPGEPGSSAPPPHKSNRVHGPLLQVNASLPDVYYIILDAYGREDSLKLFMGYDNSPFIHELEKRGFYIPSRSRANYDETPLCLASSLNFTYLDELARRAGPSGSLESCRIMLDDNAVAAHLSKLGYRYVYIGSGVKATSVETADLTLNNLPDIPQVGEEVFGPAAVRAYSPVHRARYDLHRNRINGVFDGLDTASKLPFKKFVFAHVLSPHPPFVFGALGQAVYPRGPLNFSDGSWLTPQIGQDKYKIGYASQLQYVNRRTLQAIDTILANSRRRPIIVIQGDHGSRMTLDWDSVNKTDVREPFSILNAYFVPKAVRAHLYEAISPVNTFPIILNDVFGGHFKRLPDRSYYSTVSAPLGFIDVTDRTEIRTGARTVRAAGTRVSSRSRMMAR